MKHEIVERLEVLWRQVILVVHDIDLEVDQTSVGQHDESLLPVAEESLRLLPEATYFADACEVVPEHLVGEGWISLKDLLL